jgi:hypothetical protein
MFKNGGGYIRYPDINMSEHVLLSDGVHLTSLGNEVFLNIYTENSGFASPTLGQHISTFRGYRILFSIRNPYINRITNHFSIHS